jgi:hypothetical protein
LRWTLPSQNIETSSDRQNLIGFARLDRRFLLIGAIDVEPTRQRKDKVSAMPISKCCDQKNGCRRALRGGLEFLAGLITDERRCAAAEGAGDLRAGVEQFVAGAGAAADIARTIIRRVNVDRR